MLGTLVRRHGQFDACEDAVQEALLAAGLQWTEGAVPDDPRSWLVTVASRRLVDGWRSESARRRREVAIAAMEVVPAPDQLPDRDDTLTLLFLCCHPALSVPSQLALTLRAVGGLTTGEIAKAFLVPEATMAQADQPREATHQGRGSALRSPAGAGARRATARRPARALPRLQRGVRGDRGTRRHPSGSHDGGDPSHPAAPSAHARRRRGGGPPRPDAVDRCPPRGPRRRGRALVPLAEQRRERWDGAQIEEGLALITRTLGTTPAGPYQLQAAIAAIHDEAPTAEATDWPQILALYEVLERVARARRDAESRGGGRDGPWPASGPGPPRDPRGRRPHDPHASARCRPGPSPRARGRRRCRSRRVPTGRDADREPSRTPLSHAAGGPPRPGSVSTRAMKAGAS